MIQIKCKKLLIFTIICLLSLEVRSYINPVQGVFDSPDPGVVWDGQFYYAATTGERDGHCFPIWQSKDLFSWTLKGYGFLTKPDWTETNFWAPEIHIVNHQYLMYYTAQDKTGRLCIGVATS